MAFPQAEDDKETLGVGDKTPGVDDAEKLPGFDDETQGIDDGHENEAGPNKI